MTTVMSVSPLEGDGINLGTYTYTSAPRTISFSGSNRGHSKNGRLLRPNNYVKDGMPQWDPYFAYARCLSRNDFQGLLEASESDISFQTTPRYRRQSQRPSISVATQVSEGERSSQLITSRDPVTAEIKALVANTLRESSMEVAAEAEEARAKMESLAAERLAAINGNAEEGEKEESIEENGNDESGEEEAAGDEEEEMEAEGGEESAEEDEGGEEATEEDEGGGEDHSKEGDKDDAETESNNGDGGGEASEKAESEADDGETKDADGESEKEDEDTDEKDDKKKKEEKT